MSLLAAWDRTPLILRAVRERKRMIQARMLGYSILADDVVFGYQLVLGRLPESDEVVDIKRSHSALDLFKDLLSSDEFYSCVYEPVLRGLSPSDDLFHGRPRPDFASWASYFIPLRRSTQIALRRCFSWPTALSVVLADSEFQSWVEIGQSTWRRGRFLDRLCRWALRRGRTIVGHLDFASTHLARGWVINLDDPSEKLTLLFLAGGSLVGSCETTVMRQDINSEYGSAEAHGYEIEYDLESQGLHGEVAHLVVKEAISGMVLAEANIPLRRQLYMDALAKVRAELERVTRMLGNLERSLPDVQHTSSFPLGAYESYHSTFYSAELENASERLARLRWKPKVSVVVPIYEPDIGVLEETVRSVFRQLYSDWELVLSDDASSSGAQVSRLVERVMREVPCGQAVVLVRGEERQGVSGATNRALACATGEYIAFLDHDDTLTDDALLCMIEALQREPRPRILYSDEDRLLVDESGATHHCDPHLKPDFDPVLLTQSNYICHLVIIEAMLCREIGSFDSEFDGAQDYDYILRAVDAAGISAVVHVPRVLYHWRVTPGSLSRDVGRAALINERTREVVAAHLARKGQVAIVGEHTELFGNKRDFTVRLYPSATTGSRATIIVPTRDRVDLLRPCIESVLRTRARSATVTDLIIVDNGSTASDCLSYLDHLSAIDGVAVQRDPSPFNWSELNNRAAQSAQGDVLVFLNNDTVALASEWCDELCFWALQPEVGAVGARLLLADGRLQHAGAVMSMSRITMHEGLGLPAGDAGFLGRHHVVHQASAVTGACLATGRAVFEQLGGFDAARFPVICNDTDYCMRLRALGKQVVFTPHAVLYHFESSTRGTAAAGPDFDRSTRAFRDRWGHVLDNDPFYNSHFEREAFPFTRLAPPTRGGSNPESTV